MGAKPVDQLRRRLRGIAVRVDGGHPRLRGGAAGGEHGKKTGGAGRASCPPDLGESPRRQKFPRTPKTQLTP